MPTTVFRAILAMESYPILPVTLAGLITRVPYVIRLYRFLQRTYPILSAVLPNALPVTVPALMWLILLITLIGHLKPVLFVTGLHRLEQQLFPTLYPGVPIVYPAMGRAKKNHSPGATSDGRLLLARFVIFDDSRIHQRY